MAPVSRDQADFAAEVLGAFEDAGLRAVSYCGTETLARRIASAHEARVPVVVIVGAREKAEGRVTLREWDGAQSVLPLAEAVAALSTRR